ncbi:MAG TPA: GIY-YIG nuclease family protein [Vicinamibacterales bacterium]|nr:GIY-YIG nuclease family protein [Vicinamibacterales bacterium]
MRIVVACFVVYIPRCCDETLYVGRAADLATRLEKHHAGEAATYTAQSRPAALVYSQELSGPRFRASRSLRYCVSGSKSDRQEGDPICPFVRLCRRPNQNQIVGHFPKRKMLRSDDQARTVLRLHELTEVSRHRPLVVRNQDAAIECGDGKDFLIL